MNNKSYYDKIFILLKNIINTFILDFFSNIIFIFKKPYKIVMFLVVVPLVFILIQLQIVVGLLFFVYYLLLFLVFLFLQIPYTLNCFELAFNFKYLLRHTFFNLLILLPRAKAYLYFYSICLFTYNKDYRKINFFLNLFLILLIILFFYFVNRYFFWIFGFSYLSFFISSIFVNKFFYFWGLNYQTNYARLQHTSINWVVNFDNTVGRANEFNIFFKHDLSSNFIVEFNFWDEILNLRSKLKFKRLDLFIKGVNVKPHVITSKFIVNNNMTFSNYSYNNHMGYIDKNISISVVTQPTINVSNNDIKQPFKLTSLFKYSFKMKNINIYNNRPLYFTPPYHLYQDSVKFQEIPEQSVELLLLQWFGHQSSLNIVFNKDLPILYLSADEFNLVKDAPTVSQYATENYINLYSNINYLTEFEQENKEFLITSNGKENYLILKNFVKSLDNVNL